MKIHIIKLDLGTFERFREQIIPLYLDAFTTGYYKAYVDPDTTGAYFQEFLTVSGRGFLALDEHDHAAGMLLVAPASYDRLLPDIFRERYDVARSYYIVELAVARDARGRGVGTGLTQAFLDASDRTKFDHVFVRTIAGNKAAVKMYVKLGFKRSVVVTTEKLKMDKSGMFIEKKQYLVLDLI